MDEVLHHLTMWLLQASCPHMQCPRRWCRISDTKSGPNVLDWLPGKMFPKGTGFTHGETHLKQHQDIRGGARGEEEKRVESGAGFPSLIHQPCVHGCCLIWVHSGWSHTTETSYLLAEGISSHQETGSKARLHLLLLCLTGGLRCFIHVILCRTKLHSPRLPTLSHV